MTCKSSPLVSRGGSFGLHGSRQNQWVAVCELYRYLWVYLSTASHASSPLVGRAFCLRHVCLLAKLEMSGGRESTLPSPASMAVHSRPRYHILGVFLKPTLANRTGMIKLWELQWKRKTYDIIGSNLLHRGVLRLPLRLHCVQAKKYEPCPPPVNSAASQI